MTALLSAQGLRVAGRLDPASFEIASGEFVGLIGPNGAGKTTLLKAALGLIAHQGHSSLTRIPLQARPRHVSYLAQEREIVWPIAVKGVVELGASANPGATSSPSARAQALLTRLGLTAFAARKVTELSGGERARVLLARALAHDAPLLLADEPCASLDPDQAMKTARLLRAEAESGRSVLATIHDLPLALGYCTRLIVLRAGRIVADGTPNELLQSPTLDEVFNVRVSSAQIAGRTGVIVSERSDPPMADGP